MDALLIELTLEHPELAEREVQAVASRLGHDCTRVGEGLMLVSGGDPGMYARTLSLSRTISAYMGSYTLQELLRHVSEMEELRGRKCAVRVVARRNRSIVPSMERTIGRAVSSVAEIDLDDPEIELRIHCTDRCIAGIRICEVDREGFERRHARNRVFSMPISIHPKYARAFLNICGVSRGMRVLDPFAGTGGFIIEGVLLGAHMVGSDIDPRMTMGVERNMRQFGLAEGWEMHQLDISQVPSLGMFDAVVTDLPYGRSSPGRNLPELYRKALEVFAAVLKEGGIAGVVVADEKLLCPGSLFETVFSFRQRVHRSLSRNYMVLRRTCRQSE